MTGDRVHVAGRVDGLVQKCAQCGAVLVDYQEGAAHTEETTAAVAPRYRPLMIRNISLMKRISPDMRR